MKSGAFRRAIGLTLLYIGGFVLLVMLQFSRGAGFAEKFGRLAVTASFPKAERDAGGRAPEKVRAEFAGFSMELSRGSPAILVGAEGSRRPIAPRAIEKREDGVKILLEGGVELRLVAGPGDRLSIAASGAAGARSLRLPYSLSSRAKLASERGAYRLDAFGAVFDLAFASAALDADSGYLVLSAGDEGLGRFALARRSEAPAKPGKPVQGEPLVAQAPKDAAAFKAEADAWRDKAWAGLSAGRYDAERLAWRGRSDSQAEPAEPRFSERAMVAYLAESLLRGSYGDALARMRPAKTRWPSELGYLSVPYLGGLNAKMPGLESADAAESKRLAQLVLDKSPELFSKEGLVRFLVDRAPASLSQDALKFAATVDPSKLTMRQAVGLFGCVVESASYLRDEENPFRAFGSVADRILAASRKVPEGIFLVTEEDGATDTRLSLAAGQYLAAFGAAEGKDALVGVGQGLVEGFFGVSDAQGIAPARVLVRSGAIEQRSGALLPEEVYPLVAKNPYYPREVSFAKDIGPGVWAWTCEATISVAVSENRYTFTVGSTAGRTYYMALYGIKSFANIQLYDIDYSPDVEFEIYDASGYLYNKQNRSLYLKMKHKKDSETIRLSF